MPPASQSFCCAPTCVRRPSGDGCAAAEPKTAAAEPVAEPKTATAEPVAEPKTATAEPVAEPAKEETTEKVAAKEPAKKTKKSSTCDLL